MSSPESSPGSELWTAPEPSGNRLTFVGTATTTMRLGGFTVLTDPNFLHRGQRVQLGYGLFSRRRTEPALQPEELQLTPWNHAAGASYRRAEEG